MTIQQIESLHADALHRYVEIKKVISKIYQENQDIIYKIISSDFQSFRSFDERFHFRITNVVPTNDIHYLIGTLVVNPESSGSRAEVTRDYVFSEIPDVFTGWINILRHYDSVMNNYYQAMFDEYSAQYNQSFGVQDDEDVIVEEDKPSVLLLLDSIITELEPEEILIPEVKEIRDDAKTLKSDIETVSHKRIKEFIFKTGKTLTKYSKTIAKPFGEKIKDMIAEFLINKGVEKAILFYEIVKHSITQGK